MVLVLRNTVVAGRRAGLYTSLGILTGKLVHITYSVLGIWWLVSRSILGIISFRSGTKSIETAEPVGWRSGRNWFAQRTGRLPPNGQASPTPKEDSPMLDV